ncbi:2-oxoglutarate (2OG) and Fe(II)-dependent oxygenase superfamily protein [Euphorbia peplus]|nr:2-oxoglutarate (2OG) and Fe(II)-dependent oxygenase superfamily protein [Euphorbia peplus]
MPFRRNIEKECTISAPPPSPIPTARGSRSAANDILSDYLENSVNIPDLSLPQPQIPIRSIPLQIDYHSLLYGDYATVELLLRSAREFGAFRIACRGIFVDDLQTFVQESDRIFKSLEETDMGKRESFDKDGKYQIIWSRSSGMAGMKNRLIGKHRQFSEKMESIGRKLDMIAELLGKIFEENIARMEFGKKLLGKESIFSLYRYNQNYNIAAGDPFSSNEIGRKICDYTWCLHLPATPSQFFVRSENGLLSFEGSPDTIVVIVGQRIEEWSMGDFKCVCKEVICEPHLQRTQPSFCLELKCLSLNFEPDYCKSCHKTISLRDQMLIMLLLYFLYKIFVVFYL